MTPGSKVLPIEFGPERFFNGIHGNFFIPGADENEKDNDSFDIDDYWECEFEHNFPSVESAKIFLLSRGLIEKNFGYWEQI